MIKNWFLLTKSNKLEEKTAGYIAAGLQTAKSLEEFSLNLSESKISGNGHL